MAQWCLGPSSLLAAINILLLTVVLELSTLDWMCPGFGMIIVLSGINKFLRFGLIATDVAVRSPGTTGSV